MNWTMRSPRPPASSSSETTTSKRCSSSSKATVRKSAHITETARPLAAPPVCEAVTRCAHLARWGVISTPTTSSAPSFEANTNKTPAPHPKSTTRQLPFSLRARTAEEMAAAKAVFLGLSFIISEYHSRRCTRANGGAAKSELSVTSNHKRCGFHLAWTSTAASHRTSFSRAGKENRLSSVHQAPSRSSQTPPSRHNKVWNRAKNASGRPARVADSNKEEVPCVKTEVNALDASMLACLHVAANISASSSLKTGT